MARRPRPQRPLSATVSGGLGPAVLNGLVGDRLERERSPLQEPISVRVDGLPVAPERAALAAAFPRLVVFVHGLMGNEVGWPFEVAEVALVGHSMGGLVSRSACHLAAKDGSATVTRSPRHPVGRVVGDTLVLMPSASGRSRIRKLGFEDEYGLHLAATNHIALLNHPGVYEKLWEWLR